jgi:hypothetical protein
MCTVPLIAYDDEERAKVTTDPRWLFVNMFFLELLLVPVSITLAPTLIDSDRTWFHIVPFSWYVFLALISCAAWEAPLGKATGLDIKTTGLYSGGYRLLILGGVLAGWYGHKELFAGLCAALTLWTLALMFHGCAVMWAQTLRLSTGVGALVMLYADRLPHPWPATASVWAGVGLLAAILAVVERCRRRRESQSPEVKGMMARLQKIQQRLSLWGDQLEPFCAADDSAHAAAHELLTIEAELPVERLHMGFFSQRLAWQRSLAHTQDYQLVLKQASTLERALVSPPSHALLLRLLAKPAVGRRGLPTPLMLEVLSFAGNPVVSNTDGPAMLAIQFDGLPTAQAGGDCFRFKGDPEDLSRLWVLVQKARYQPEDASGGRKVAAPKQNCMQKPLLESEQDKEAATVTIGKEAEEAEDV